MRRTAWRPARRNRADALDRPRRRCTSSPRRCALAFASACHRARTCGERTPRVTIGGRHHRCTVSSRVGLVCGQAVRRNAGFEPALPASRAGALPTELIPGRLGAHKTLGTHRTMGSVSAPDGPYEPEPWNAARRPTSVWRVPPPSKRRLRSSSSPLLDSFPPFKKKALFGNPTKAFSVPGRMPCALLPGDRGRSAHVRLAAVGRRVVAAREVSVRRRPCRRRRAPEACWSRCC